MELHDDPRARAVHLAVYAALSGADGMTFRTGEGRVLASEIERRAKVNRSTRKAAIRDLVEWGYIEVEDGDSASGGAWRGTARFYRLPHLKKGAGKSPPYGRERGRETAGKGVTSWPSPYIQRDTEVLDEEAEEFAKDRRDGEGWADYLKRRRREQTAEVSP